MKFATHYGITPEFMRNYGWQFADRSFVFANACSGLDSSTPDLKAATADLKNHLFAANVSTFVGWVGKPNNKYVHDAAAYLFDRMLGANKITQVGNAKTGIVNVAMNPPPRPFSLDNGLLSDMANARLSNFSVPAIALPGQVPTPAHVALLEYATNPAQTAAFGILTPSIDYLDVQESSRTITVYGTFGTIPGRSR